jgi:hypothetical protein
MLFRTSPVLAIGSFRQTLSQRLCLTTGSALLILAVLCATASAAAQRPAGACPIRDFPAPELCIRARLDTVKATYIVLLDASGSMRPRWGSVKSAVETFIKAVPDGDILDVRLFSTSVSRLNAPMTASPVLVAQLAQQVASLPAPSGERTDLGVALETALDAIASAPASQQHFVYILTDGAQDPAVGSGYPADGSGRWPELRKKALALKSSRPVSFALVRLTAQADSQKLLAGALPNPDIVPAVTSPQLRSWFDNEARSIAVRKLRLLIQSEGRLPALLDSTSNSITLGEAATVQRQQLRQATAAEVTERAVVTLEDGSSVTVAPAQLSNVSVTLETRAPDRAWYLPPQSGERMIFRTVPVRVRLSPADELGRIGIDASPQTDSLRIAIPVRTGGAAAVIGYWSAVIAGLTLITFAALRAKWAAHTALLRGRVRLEVPGRDDETIDFASIRSARYDVMSGAGRVIATLEATNFRGTTAIWLVPGPEPVRVGTNTLRKRTRVHAPVRLEHRDVVAHYFPN